MKIPMMPAITPVAHSIRKHLIWITILLLTLTSLPAQAGDMLLKGGETIAFMGDSITQAGNRKGGYVNLVVEALNHEGLDIKKIPAGISGHRSIDMLNRLDRDVKNKLTTDGCHMNQLGNIMMAKGVLRAFGMSEKKIEKAEERWLEQK